MITMEISKKDQVLLRCPSRGKIETMKESYRLFISELFRKSDYNEKHPSD